MNELIESIFADFTVDGVQIPVSFMFYEGHGAPYVVYMQQDADGSLSADDELQGYVDYYDFDVYSKSDYSKVIEQIKEKLQQKAKDGQ
jgi:acetoacetate decarboxylase